jgi:hypothetical protein
MRRLIAGTLLAVAVTGGSALAHHSYSAYHRDQTIEIEGVLEAFDYMSPHSLLKVRAADATLYTGEWSGTSALQRFGIGKDTLSPGDRLVIAGNPRRDIAETGILNLRAVRRPADGWNWAAGGRGR